MFTAAEMPAFSRTADAESCSRCACAAYGRNGKSLRALEQVEVRHSIVWLRQSAVRRAQRRRKRLGFTADPERSHVKAGLGLPSGAPL
jgi:hypothetical protein